MIYLYIKKGIRLYDISIWETFNDVLNYLPLCATLNDKIICMHGGLSPKIKSI